MLLTVGYSPKSVCIAGNRRQIPHVTTTTVVRYLLPCVLLVNPHVLRRHVRLSQPPQIQGVRRSSRRLLRREWACSPQLPGQSPMCCIIFGHDKATARLFVETMNDAGTLFSTDSRQRDAVIEQRIYQSVLAMAYPGVNHESRRLIDDDEIVIFEENLKRDRLWQSLGLFRRWFGEINLIVAADNLAGPANRAVESNKPAADQLLEPRPREFWQSFRQKLIETQFCIFR